MRNSANKFDESEAVKAAIDSMLEAKTKEATQKHILDSINTTHIANAVSQQIQQQTQGKLFKGQEISRTTTQ